LRMRPFHVSLLSLQVNVISPDESDFTHLQRVSRFISGSYWSKKMNETTNDNQSVYEISYLIPTSVAEENVPSESDSLKKIITDAGAAVIAEEAPHRESLAYSMRRKTVSGSYNKYDEAYFGWVKFTLGSDKIEAVKKIFDTHPSVLRFLLITTTAENTYLGKRASSIAASFGVKSEPTEVKVEEKVEEKKDVAPLSIEEVDKSIDEMVKEAI
jgi:ribosomal protein S6